MLHCMRGDVPRFVCFWHKAAITRLRPNVRFRGFTKTHTINCKLCPFHRAVMPPKPNGTSSWIKNSTLIREIEHGRYVFSQYLI